MPMKGDNTKAEILHAAKALFCEKGYAAVTMSDICEATGLSRGGLYRHYSSTADIFIALLLTDKDDKEQEMAHAISAGIPAYSMLSYFFEQTLQGLFEDGRLSLAIYELSRSGHAEQDFLSNRYDYAVDMLTRLLAYGQSRSEFSAFDAGLMAEHIVLFIEGVKVASTALPGMCETASRQFEDLLKQLTTKEIHHDDPNRIP